MGSLFPHRQIVVLYVHITSRSAHALPAHDLKPTRDAARRQPQGRRADTPLYTRKLDMFSSVKSSVYKRRS